MGLFDFLKRKPGSAPEAVERPSLIAALDQWRAPNVPAAAKLLEPLTARKVVINLDTGGDDKVLAGSVNFGGHHVRVVGFDVATPKSVMEKTVECSAWKDEPRRRLQNHGAHLILFHEEGGKDAADRLTALFQIAAALGGDNLAGVIHENAWTCTPAGIARDLLDFEEAKKLKELIPPVVFFGILPFREEGGSWVATKGCHLFGVPDLVIESADVEFIDRFDLLHNIVAYMVQGTRIAAGHTMQTGEDQYFRFAELSPEHKYFDSLKGTGETLELIRISREETAAG